jgi:sigma-B regulation protein RsbU (phosphoserine phosphatase)
MEIDGGHLLIVDDNRMNRIKLTRSIEQQGHRTAQAENGRQALEMLKGQSFDLVLLDIIMPEMNGYQVLEHMKQDDALREIPVVVISAVDQLDSVVQCIEMGAEDYLPKSFDPVLLRARIGACLEKKRLRDEARALLHRLEGELEEARQLQLSMVPSEFPLSSPDRPVSIHAFMEPAREVGGDLYDFFYLGHDTLCFLIGDVSDKGAAAGMFMARTCSLVRVLAKQWHAVTGDVPTPDQILNELNTELCDNNPQLTFVTVFLALLNVATGELSIASAGHSPPYLLRDGGPAELGPLARGRPLGVRRDSTYESESIHLDQGDGLFLYTDGITDAVNASGELYSEERLKTDLGTLDEAAPHEVIDKVLRKVKAFAGDSPQFDDITMLAVRWDAS